MLKQRAHGLLTANPCRIALIQLPSRISQQQDGTMKKQLSSIYLFHLAGNNTVNKNTVSCRAMCIDYCKVHTFLFLLSEPHKHSLILQRPLYETWINLITILGPPNISFPHILRLFNYDRRKRRWAGPTSNQPLPLLLFEIKQHHMLRIRNK